MSCLLIQLGFFSKVENRRGFFEKYARDNHFDPYSPENWYHQPFSRILTMKVNLIFFIYYIFK